MDIHIKPGLYRHYKGNIYRVVAVAQHSETHERVVVYQKADGSEWWVRPHDMFVEYLVVDGIRTPRFTFLEE